ncbi:MAG TPA: glycosyltransferase family 2 protein [Acidobacteriaceae bacterium]|jgi:GT2 family glycosyltransferase|nr:glycosyltransferase family 2 protein [Acidobacteriaceae bacterium]
MIGRFALSRFVLSQGWRDLLEYSAWALAGLWMWRTREAIRRLPGVPDLNTNKWDLVPPPEAPWLTVVVPARNEAENLGASLEALLAQEYEHLWVLAVDDRSTDGTGKIVDEYVARQPDRVGAIHVDYLPEGWLGKTFALEVGVRNSASEYLLFTDADVLFSPSSLRRAMACAAMTKADHLVVYPTPLVKGRGEGIVLGFFQVLGLWAARPWKVPDPRARRDVVGIGAFNLVRREALEVLGGWEPQRLAVLEDVTLGRRMKAAGMRQVVAFGPDLVLVHWATGARGLVRVMTKNLFSGVNFRPALLLGGVAVVFGLFLLPLAGLVLQATVVPSLLILCCIGACYRLMGGWSLIDARYGWLYPLGALAMIWAMLRSMLSAMVRRGVMWRGTFYPLRELREHNSPFVWERAAAKARRMEAKGEKRVGNRLLAVWPALRERKKTNDVQTKG